MAIRPIKRPSKAGIKRFRIEPQAETMKKRDEEKKVRAVTKRLAKYNPVVRKLIDDPNYIKEEKADGTLVIRTKPTTFYGRIRVPGKGGAKSLQDSYSSVVYIVQPGGGVTETHTKDYVSSYMSSDTWRKTYTPEIKKYDQYGYLTEETKYMVGQAGPSGRNYKPRLHSQEKYQGGELVYSKEKEYSDIGRSKSKTVIDYLKKTGYKREYETRGEKAARIEEEREKAKETFFRRYDPITQRVKKGFGEAYIVDPMKPRPMTKVPRIDADDERFQILEGRRVADWERQTPIMDEKGKIIDWAPDYITLEEMAIRQASRRLTPTAARREFGGYDLITTPDVLKTGMLSQATTLMGGLEKPATEQLVSETTPVHPYTPKEGKHTITQARYNPDGTIQDYKITYDNKQIVSMEALGKPQRAPAVPTVTEKDSKLSNIASRIALLNAQINNEKTRNFITRDPIKLEKLEKLRDKLIIVIDDATGKQGTGEMLVTSMTGGSLTADKELIYTKLADAKGIKPPTTFVEKAAQFASPALMQKIVSTPGTGVPLKLGDLDIVRTTPTDNEEMRKLKEAFSTTDVDITADKMSFGEAAVRGSSRVTQMEEEINRDTNRRLQILTTYAKGLESDAGEIIGGMDTVNKTIEEYNKQAEVDLKTLDAPRQSLAEKLFIFETVSLVNNSNPTKVSHANAVKAQQEYLQAFDTYEKAADKYSAKYDNDTFGNIADKSAANKLELEGIAAEGERLTGYGQQIIDAGAQQIHEFKLANDPRYRFTPTGAGGAGERMIFKEDFGLSSEGKKTWLSQAADGAEAIMRKAGKAFGGVVSTVALSRLKQIDDMKADIKVREQGGTIDSGFIKNVGKTPVGYLARAVYDWEDPKNAQYDWKKNVNWTAVKSAAETAAIATVGGYALATPAAALPIAAKKYAIRLGISTITAKASSAGAKKFGELTAPKTQMLAIQRADFSDAMRAGYAEEQKTKGLFGRTMAGIPGVQLTAGSKWGTKFFKGSSRENFTRGVTDYYAKTGLKGKDLETVSAAALRQRNTGLWGELIGVASANVASEVWGNKMISEALATVTRPRIGVGFWTAAPRIAASGTIEGASVYIASQEGRYKPFVFDEMVDSMIWGGAIAGAVGGTIAGAKTRGIGGGFWRGTPVKKTPVSTFIGKGLEYITYILDPWEKPGDIGAGILAKIFPKAVGTKGIIKVGARGLRAPVVTITPTTIGGVSETVSVPSAEGGFAPGTLSATPVSTPVQTTFETHGVPVPVSVRVPTPITMMTPAPTPTPTPAETIQFTVSEHVPVDIKTVLPTETPVEIALEKPVPDPVPVPPPVPVPVETSTQTFVTMPTQTDTRTSTQISTSVPISTDFTGQMPFGRGRWGMGGALAGSWVVENKIRDFGGEWLGKQQMKTIPGLTGVGFEKTLTPTQTVKAGQYIIPTGMTKMAMPQLGKYLPSTGVQQVPQMVAPQVPQMVAPQVPQMGVPQMVAPQVGAPIQPFTQTYAVAGRLYQPGMILQPGQIVNPQGIVIIPKTGNQKAQTAVDKLFGKKGLSSAKISMLMTPKQTKLPGVPRRPTQMMRGPPPRRKTSLGSFLPRMTKKKVSIGV